MAPDAAPGSAPPAALPPAGTIVAAPPTEVTPPAATPPAATPPAAAPPAVAAPVIPPAEVGAPSAYALTAPDNDGFKEHWADSDLAAFESRARRNNWTNTEAQAHLDSVPADNEATRDMFRQALAADSVLGGKNLEATEANVIRALDHFSPKDTPHGRELRRVMTLTGYGNLPSHVAAWDAVGRALAEDDPSLEGGKVNVEDLSPEDRLYPGPGIAGSPGVAKSA